MTTLEKNKEIVLRFNMEFIQDGNMDTFNELVSSDFNIQTLPPGMPGGPDGILYFFNKFIKTSFQHLKVEIHDIVAEDDKVITRKTFYAIHTNTFLEVPATNRRVMMEVMDITRVEDGKLVEHWNVLDWGYVMAQIIAR